MMAKLQEEPTKKSPRQLTTKRLGYKSRNPGAIPSKGLLSLLDNYISGRGRDGFTFRLLKEVKAAGKSTLIDTYKYVVKTGNMKLQQLPRTSIYYMRHINYIYLRDEVTTLVQIKRD